MRCRPYYQGVNALVLTLLSGVGSRSGLKPLCKGSMATRERKDTVSSTNPSVHSSKLKTNRFAKLIWIGPLTQWIFFCFFNWLGN